MKILDGSQLLPSSSGDEARILATAAIGGKGKAEGEAAAEQLLEKVLEGVYWLEEVEQAGVLTERIKRVVAWPVAISFQPKDTRYFKTVVADLQKKGLGSQALTGRNNRSGGKKGSLARDWANLVHGVIFEIYHLKRIAPSPEDSPTKPSSLWDTSKIWGEIAFSVEVIAYCHPKLLKSIKSQASIKPSATLWRRVGQRVFHALRPDSTPQPTGRRKMGAELVGPAARKERAAIARAYVDLANRKNKSRDNPEKWNSRKKKRR